MRQLKMKNKDPNESLYRLKQRLAQLNKEDDQPIQYTYSSDDVIIVDGTNNFIRCMSIVQQTNKPLNVAIQMFFYSIHRIIQLYKPKLIYFIFDGYNNIKSRRKVNQEYKKNRGKKKKKNNVNKNEQNYYDIVLTLLFELIRNLPIIFISIDQIEADDIIAYIAKRQNGLNNRGIIVSTDRDFYQLAQNNVIYNPITKRFITKDRLLQRYNVTPQNFIYYKAICGDNSDNVKGIKGIGDKTFNKYYSQLFNKEIIINLNQTIQKVECQKYRDLLKNNINLIRQNVKLMDLGGYHFITPSDVSKIQFCIKQSRERVIDKNIDQIISKSVQFCNRKNLFITKSHLHSYLRGLYETIFINLKKG